MIIVTIIAVCICSLSRPPVGPVSVSPSVSSRAKAGRVFLFPFVLFFANSHETTPFVSLSLSQSVWAKKCSTFLWSPLWRMRVLCDKSRPIPKCTPSCFLHLSLPYCVRIAWRGSWIMRFGGSLTPLPPSPAVENFESNHSDSSTQPVTFAA